MQNSVLEYLESAAENFPNKTAFIDKNKQITFKETKKFSLCIAGEISKRYSKRNSPILVYLPKNVDCIPVFMGILYSGNFYTPIDIKFPFQKVQTILDVLKPELIISDEKNSDTLLKNGIPADKILDIDSICFSNEPCDSKKFLNEIISTDPVYTFFTSGSTGVPKGVIINNLSIIDYVDWAAEKFNITSETIMGSQSPFYFDISTQDIYATLKCAATLVIIPEEYFIFPVKALNFINEHDVNFLYWVPSAFVNVSKLDLLSEVKLPNVNTMIFGGEVMPVKHLNYWLKNVPSLRCVSNVCGPTETTVNYSCYILDREFKDDELLPLGQPIPNRELLLLDENEKPVTKQGELGEIYVRGVALSPGYYNNPQKTSEMFVQNPLNDLYPELVYKTGDLAFYNDRGELVYAGRKDFQIKHMGYRIELGEIETASNAIDEIKECCCFHDKTRDEIILCYVGNISAVDITSKLSRVLPKYMIPTRFEKIDQMPLNSNGKIDRKFLQSKFIRNCAVDTPKLWGGNLAFLFLSLQILI